MASWGGGGVRDGDFGPRVRIWATLFNIQYLCPEKSTYLCTLKQALVLMIPEDIFRAVFYSKQRRPLFHYTKTKFIAQLRYVCVTGMSSFPRYN
jgi:hypothetical protein